MRKKLSFFEYPIQKAETGCWLWLGGKHPRGYGHFCINGKTVTTHRQAWVETHGPIPAGLHVLHRCDVRHCVNPDHLWLGTNADNMADKARKGRAFALRGEDNPRAKLTDAAVRAIRGETDSAVKVGAKYGVSHAVVWAIRHGKQWAHVKDLP